MNKPCAKISE